MGNEVLKCDFVNQVDINCLKNGFYFVLLFSKEGTLITQSKLLINR